VFMFGMNSFAFRVSFKDIPSELPAFSSFRWNLPLFGEKYGPGSFF